MRSPGNVRNSSIARARPARNSADAIWLNTAGDIERIRPLQYQPFDAALTCPVALSG